MDISENRIQLLEDLVKAQQKRIRTLERMVFLLEGTNSDRDEIIHLLETEIVALHQNSTEVIEA